jgi:hypothetical protein
MEEFINLIYQEQEKYLDYVAKLSPEEIINKAYEICYRNEIVSILETEFLDDEAVEVLMSMPNPVSTLYQVWLDTDASVVGMLEDVICDFVQENK